LVVAAPRFPTFPLVEPDRRFQNEEDVVPARLISPIASAIRSESEAFSLMAFPQLLHKYLQAFFQDMPLS